MNAVPLDKAEVEAQLYAIIAKQPQVDAAGITPAATLKDLGIASIEAIELIFDIEEHFDITFPDQGANFDTDTVQQLIDAVAEALAQKSAQAGSP